MLSIDDMDMFEFSKNVKRDYSWIPIVILTPFFRDVSIRIEHESLDSIDFIFSWLGNTDIILAIIKLVEDQLNAENDIEHGVQAILLVEDSVRYYSSFLSMMYRLIFEHTKDLERETLNENQKMLRKRGRPKILLANTYEEAIIYYDKYKNNLLGIITDMGFPKNGVRDKNAGRDFITYIQKENPYIPILLQSSEIRNQAWAEENNVSFLLKNSPRILHNIKSFMKNFLAFGDFVFINPHNMSEVGRATNLASLQNILTNIPDDSLLYHLKRNHLSRWLNARALFNLGGYLKKFTLEEFIDLNDVKDFVIKSISSYRRIESSGVIAQFNRDTYDKYVSFARIGEGMIGGKARGLAFLDLILSKFYLNEKYENVRIYIPKTVVLATSIFDEFMEINRLNEKISPDFTDKEILNLFVNSVFPEIYIQDIKKFIETVKKPIAVRSSSLLEDSYYQPFAGVYSTYMMPITNNIDHNLNMVITAIKSVYASVYFSESRAYMSATQNVIDEEKMSIVLQAVTGSERNGKFYPIISGVARSMNFYPIGDEKTDDGIVNLAFGLGKQIVEGETTLHFSPGAPEKILQLLDAKTSLTQTQKSFYAIDLENPYFKPSTDDSITLKKYKLSDAENDKSLNSICSVYNFQTDTLYDGDHYDGKKVLTFNNILKYHKIPLVDIIKDILNIGQKQMGYPVEIEFAANFDFSKSEDVIFRVLQIRPIVDCSESINSDLEKVNLEETILYSKSALGNGKISDIHDLIYIKPSTFDSTNNPEIAEIVGKLNDKFKAEGKNYYLIGPGRWGSRDRWLGVPVKWSQISSARIIVESGLDNYRIEPSQGTHFFQNLTSFRVGYFTINPYCNDGYYDIDFLSNCPAIYEDEFVRHLHFENPLIAKIDGKKRIGVIYKPKNEE